MLSRLVDCKPDRLCDGEMSARGHESMKCWTSTGVEVEPQCERCRGECGVWCSRTGGVKGAIWRFLGEMHLFLIRAVIRSCERHCQTQRHFPDEGLRMMNGQGDSKGAAPFSCPSHPSPRSQKELSATAAWTVFPASFVVYLS